MNEKVAKKTISKGKKSQRQPSEYPISSLKNALEVAQVVHKWGGTAKKENLEAIAKGGALGHRIFSARVFNLIKTEGRNYKLTEISAAYFSPNATEKTRKVWLAKAFLSVDIFNRLTRDRIMNTGVLLERPYLKNVLKELGVKEEDVLTTTHIIDKAVEEISLETLIAVAKGTVNLKEEKLGAAGIENGGAPDKTQLEKVIIFIEALDKYNIELDEKQVKLLIDDLVNLSLNFTTLVYPLKLIKNLFDEKTLDAKVTFNKIVDLLVGLGYMKKGEREGGNTED